MTGCSYILGADSDRKQTVHKMLLHGRMQQEQARKPHGRTENIENRARQPVLWVPPIAPESAIERTRSGAEQRARTTATAILTAA